MERKKAVREMFERGMGHMRKNDYINAVFCFEEMVNMSDRSADSLSILGLAMARGGVDFALAEKHCTEALEKAPQVADYYRCLGEVYIAWGKRQKAIWILNKGLAVDGDKGNVKKDLEKLGTRQKPPIPFLGRSNLLNIYLGRLKSKL